MYPQAAEAPPATDAAKPKDPVKTITKSVLITLAVLFIYHVASDRVTPYTSQSNIEVLLVQGIGLGVHWILQGKDFGSCVMSTCGWAASAAASTTQPPPIVV